MPRDLSPLADKQGHLRILTIDARAALRKMIAQFSGTTADGVPRADVIAFKRAVLENLAAHATAVLVDDDYCIPACMDAVPKNVGLLFPAEESDYERAGSGEMEFKERIGWNQDNVLKAKPHGVKFLVHYRHDGAAEVRRHQQQIVKQLGEFCKAQGLIYILEPICYPLFDDEMKGERAGAVWAKRRADIIVDFAREFSQPQYLADLLKVEFPADLKYVADGPVGPHDGPKVFSVDDVRRYCREVDALTPLPWAILSLGVSLDEFIAQLDFATAAGACGFLCGRSIWKSALPLWGNPAAMNTELKTVGVANLEKMNAVMAKAKPWFYKANSLRAAADSAAVTNFQ